MSVCLSVCPLYDARPSHYGRPCVWCKRSFRVGSRLPMNRSVIIKRPCSRRPSTLAVNTGRQHTAREHGLSTRLNKTIVDSRLGLQCATHDEYHIVQQNFIGILHVMLVVFCCEADVLRRNFYRASFGEKKSRRKDNPYFRYSQISL